MAFPCFYKEELKYVDELKKYCASVDTVLINPFWGRFKALFYILSRTPLTLPYFYSPVLHKKILKKIEEEEFDLIYIFLLYEAICFECERYNENYGFCRCGFA